MKKRSLITALFLLTFIYIARAGLDSLFYHPDSNPYHSPSQNNLTFEDITFESADGTRLNGWFIPATGKALGTVVHFHGNAQNMTAHYAFVSWLPRSGFNLFVFDYRGYGKSEGTPSRNGVYEDGVAAMNYIKSRTDIDQDRIIVFGQSIGGATALTVLGNNDFEGIAGIAVDSAFCSYKSVAAEHAGMLKPFAYILISNKLSPKKVVEHITPVPLLIIHAKDDPVVSYRHAEKLLRQANEPKELWTLNNGGHTAVLGPHAKTYAPLLHRKFLEWVSAH